MQLWWRKVIFKSTIGNESLRQDSNDNGVRIVNFVTSKHLVVKGTMFFLMERLTTRLIIYGYIGDGIRLYSITVFQGIRL